MDMEDKETAPGTVLLAVDVARRQAELRRRSVIMTEDPVEAAEWLRTYRHPMTELISIGPWASYSAFNQGAGVDLPRLLLSDRVRSACAVEVGGSTTRRSRRSTFLHLRTPPSGLRPMLRRA